VIGLNDILAAAVLATGIMLYMDHSAVIGTLEDMAKQLTFELAIE